MTDQNPIEVNFGILRADIPEQLVDAMLQRQRSRDLFQRVSILQWQSLQTTHPHLIHYISTVCLEVAPSDPLLREQIAASFLGLYALLDESAIQASFAGVIGASDVVV